jgi:hypothetical protein
MQYMLENLASNSFLEEETWLAIFEFFSNKLWLRISRFSFSWLKSHLL